VIAGKGTDKEVRHKAAVCVLWRGGRFAGWQFRVAIARASHEGSHGRPLSSTKCEPAAWTAEGWSSEPRLVGTDAHEWPQATLIDEQPPPAETKRQQAHCWPGRVRLPSRMMMIRCIVVVCCGEDRSSHRYVRSATCSEMLTQAPTL